MVMMTWYTLLHPRAGFGWPADHELGATERWTRHQPTGPAPELAELRPVPD